MFADSTDFPLQRDFIDLVERLADMAIEALPTQQQIFELKESIKSTEGKKTAKLSKIDDFEYKIGSSIDNVTEKFGEGGFKGVSEAIKGDAADEVLVFRKAEEKLFNEQLKTLNSELKKRQTSLLHILGEFLYYDPLDVSEVEILVSREGKTYASSLGISCSSGIEYKFGLNFSKKELRVEDLTKKRIHIPSSMRPTMLSKEKKPHMVEINDWILSKAEYRSNAETTLEATLVKSMGNESPRIEMVIRPGETKIQCLNFVDDDGNVTDILKDEQLKKNIDADFEEFTKYLLGHFFGLMDEKKQIVSAGIDGKDLLEEDLIEDLVMKAAGEYSKTIGTIRERGLVTNELNLKAEDLEGKRTEIYLKIDEFKSKMAAIQQGPEICTELGLD
jgi:hypothetical protein